MKQRCLNPKAARFDRYGGRQISICERWLHSFKAFLDDMGERPEGTSLDRKDNNKGYEPGNCRWATRKEQMSNYSRNKWVHFDGARINLRDASQILHKTWGALFYALSKNGLLITGGHYLVPEWTEMKHQKAYAIDDKSTAR